MSLFATLLAVETLFLWKGETQSIWQDFTNATDRLVLVKSSSDSAFVRTGVALPVRGDADRLYADRVVWNGSFNVLPGECVRVVAEVSGKESCPFTLRTPLGDIVYAIDVAAREFPGGKDRRLYLDLWQHPWAVARYYQVLPFSESHYVRMAPLWRELASAGQKTITATIMSRPWAHQCFDEYGTMVRHIRLADGKWKFNYAIFDQYVTFAKSCGLGPQIHCYTLCPFRLKRYIWEDEDGRRQEGDFDVGSSEWRDYWTCFLNDFAAHLKSRGWFFDTYIALDERSPSELKIAVAMAKENGGFKIAMAGDRPPSQFAGIEIDNFSIALQYMTPKYLAETTSRRAQGKTTTFYTAGSNPCTSLKNAPEYVQWIGAYAGALDLDGYLRWAFCSWPANPNADAQYNPWFGKWTSGGTYLYYPDGPSVRYLALKNGLNLSEKILRLRAEGRIDTRLDAVLKEFEYKGDKTYPAPSVVADLLKRAAAEVQRVSR